MGYLSSLTLALVMVLSAVACATTSDTTWPNRTDEPLGFTVSDGQGVIWPHVTIPVPLTPWRDKLGTKDPSKPSRPRLYSEQGAIAVLKNHLMEKSAPAMYAEEGTSCWETLDHNPDSWSAKYDSKGARWDIRGRANDQIREKARRDNKSMGWFTWSVYERTYSVLPALGSDEPLNRAC